MDKRQMRKLFRPEQGCKIEFDSPQGSEVCRAKLAATDADAAVLGLGLLVIRLAEELKVPAENVLAVLAVAIMKIGQKVNGEAEQ